MNEVTRDEINLKGIECQKRCSKWLKLNGHVGCYLFHTFDVVIKCMKHFHEKLTICILNAF